MIILRNLALICEHWHKKRSGRCSPTNPIFLGSKRPAWEKVLSRKYQTINKAKMIKTKMSLAFGLLAITASAASAATAQFSNPASISSFNLIPETSVITVSGLVGTVSDVNVTINNYYSDEIAVSDILLISPAGQSSILMRYVGLGKGGPATFTFDDEAASSMSLFGFDPSGNYKPTDFKPQELLLTPPAPAGPYGAELSLFDGVNPNGNWTLYFRHSYGTPAFIQDGWSLDIATVDIATVPESSSAVVLLGLSLSGVGLFARFRRDK